MKKQPTTVRGAEDLGRIRLSRTLFMRDLLYIANIHGMTNLPADPELPIAAGRELCEQLLEPLQATFGRLALRSGYRSPAVNGFGNAHNLSCASNGTDRARHIWDQRDDEGMLGAMVTIVVPWLLDRLDGEVTWQAMAWWIHDHLPYSEPQFFPKHAAFNIAWREVPRLRIFSWVAPRGVLTKPGFPNQKGNHSALYVGFPEPVPTRRGKAAGAPWHSVGGSDSSSPTARLAMRGRASVVLGLGRGPRTASRT
jgi:hypothetical protein